MKIAVIHPTTFARLRRGTERFALELCRYLAGSGHSVTMIACKPGRGEVVVEDGFETRYFRRLWHPSLGRVGVLEFHTFLLTTFTHLVTHRYDVVHCFSFADAFAAVQARRWTRVPCVLYVNAIPPPVRYFRSITLGGAIFRRAVKEADEVMVPSEYVRRYVSNRFGRETLQEPVPVDITRFVLSTNRNHERPVVLCTAALDDERKGGRLLMRAFDKLKTIRPEVRLHISSEVKEATASALTELVAPRWRQDIHFLGHGAVDTLPLAYGTAAVSVLPSLWEAFGMVILESMATGTPVVGTHDGAIPELISNLHVGRTFPAGELNGTDPSSVDSLVRALLEALELSRDPETAIKCRHHAEQFAWERVGPRYEAVYRRLVRNSKIRRLDRMKGQDAV